MNLEHLYRYARKRHGELGRDVVHDLLLKFGTDLPSDAYLTTCIKHARVAPAQEMFEVHNLNEHEEHEEHDIDVTIKLNHALRITRKKYELEVDTFLECCVNSTYAEFSQYSGISVSVLRKICAFVKKEIQDEFNKLG